MWRLGRPMKTAKEEVREILDRLPKDASLEVIQYHIAVCRKAQKALDAEVLRCSFCSKSQSEVRKLIAGPAVYICDECVDVCQEIIADTVIDKPDDTHH